MPPEPNPLDPGINPDAPSSPPEPADSHDPATAARAAETHQAELADRLASVEALATDLRQMLEQAEHSRAIDRELLAGGVIDLDTARAAIEERVASGATITQSVAQLRERRPQLFAPRGRPIRATTIAAAPAHPILDDVAAAARETGDRRLLLDYLRLRRTQPT
ncbi:MAG: hypothetical protein IPJ41_14980 [Phycisphaerales bacterium]|nr:hypothetical protein [Phycisphaerales bacterium]